MSSLTVSLITLLILVAVLALRRRFRDGEASTPSEQLIVFSQRLERMWVELGEIEQDLQAFADPPALSEIQGKLQQLRKVCGDLQARLESAAQQVSGSPNDPAVRQLVRDTAPQVDRLIARVEEMRKRVHRRRQQI